MGGSKIFRYQLQFSQTSKNGNFQITLFKKRRTKCNKDLANTIEGEKNPRVCQRICRSLFEQKIKGFFKM